MAHSVFHPEIEERPAPGFMNWCRRWWQRQSPGLQDNLALLAPLASVVVFLVAVATALWYLRAEEMDREHDSVRRDVEYAHQQVRLRLLERQEQLMLLARDIVNVQVGPVRFAERADQLLLEHPELISLSWLDPSGVAVATQAGPSVLAWQRRMPGQPLHNVEVENTFALARDLKQPVYSQASAGAPVAAPLQLHIPLYNTTQFTGDLFAEISLDGLMRYGVPADIASKYAVSFLDRDGAVLAGAALFRAGPAALGWLGRRAVPLRRAGVPGRQRTATERAAVSHLAGRDRQQPVLAGGCVEPAHLVDARGHVTPHPTPAAGAAGARGRDELSPRDGKLDPDRNARA